MISFVVLWAALAIATLGLALYRKFVSMREETYIHLGAGEETHIPEQVKMAKRISAIDRWGEALTVATVVIGLVLVAVYLYQQWH